MVEGLPERIHCVGAGGAGMLPLTLFLAKSGHQMSAEDDRLGDRERRILESAGVSIAAFEENPELAFVYSSAIPENHPARVFARATGCVAMRRGECLAVVAQSKRLIAVAGSHGKTTTSGMIVDLFNQLGGELNYVLGAQFVSGDPFKVSDSEWLLAEIDESDGTIDLFSPEICVILNADHDHHARYKSRIEYLDVFARLIQRAGAFAIVDQELESELKGASSLTRAEMVWLGNDAGIAFDSDTAGPGWSEARFDLGEEGTRSVVFNRTGEANQLDTAFAILATIKAGIEFPDRSVVEFTSIRRRQQSHYCSPEIRVFEDYAHHPIEIEAVLAQLGETSDRRRAVVFQPHRYSRTKELKLELAQSLRVCDSLLLLDVYAASEAPLEGGSGQDLFDLCKSMHSDCVFCESESALWTKLETKLAEGELDILFLGAGEGDRLAKEFCDSLAERDGAVSAVYRSIGRTARFHSLLGRDEALAPKTTLRVGGAARLYLEPSSLDELVAAIRSCAQAGIPVYPLGRGSNLIVPEGGVDGLVIRLNHPRWSQFEQLGDGAIRVGAGLRIKVLCGQACKLGLSGFEFLEGIPGSVGGVLRMNAGAMGGWVCDVVESIRYVDLEGRLREANREALAFGYRSCRELEKAIVIDATLRGDQEKAQSDSIRERIDTYQNARKESQPREPSAGCIFKNPEGDSAGRLIEELGLKGARVGGAEISQVHGNFIVNRGDATSSDVLELMKFARAVAKERKGIELEPEVMLFGSSWEEALG